MEFNLFLQVLAFAFLWPNYLPAPGMALPLTSCWMLPNSNSDVSSPVRHLWVRNLYSTSRLLRASREAGHGLKAAIDYLS